MILLLKLNTIATATCTIISIGKVSMEANYAQQTDRLHEQGRMD